MVERLKENYKQLKELSATKTDNLIRETKYQKAQMKKFETIIQSKIFMLDMKDDNERILSTKNNEISKINESLNGLLNQSKEK
jgi:hypothetical protein